MTDSPQRFASQTRNFRNRSLGRPSKSAQPRLSLTISEKKRAVWDLFNYEYLVTHQNKRIARWANEIPWRAIAETGLHSLGLTNHFSSAEEIYQYTQFLAMALADHWEIPCPN